ncbi:hypothetical protein [Conexibacter arvalis]|uniref:Uncharacterized protein n=1 Tax=Conexibacter arvalis TaxID=912552 RepID=A0A840ICZ6_9ACTN|nr:hypothetical protein [Conexibacter arvalis]MBB4662215.1 hypothetical protein [Conexibacter arvalis]
MSEFRGWVGVPSFPDGRDEAWMRLLSWLDTHTDTGPILDGPADDRAGVRVVLATEANGEAAAVRAMVDVTTRALEAIGLGDRSPTSVELERVA